MYNDIKKAFWTGGWDSTFMVIEQLMKGNNVQPIYIIDEERKSKEYELKCMEVMTDLINQNEKIKGKLYPLILVKLEEIAENQEITEAYKKINKVTKLGAQHEWLARYALHNKGIMIGTEYGEPQTSHIIDTIQKFCVMKKEDDYQIVDLEKSSKEGKLILGSLQFPIIDKTENDMKNLIHEWNMEDIMKNIWFCHTPIKNKPCGLCHPCEVKIESNMEFLLPEEALKKYRFTKKIGTIFGEKSKKFTIKVLRKLGG